MPRFDRRRSGGNLEAMFNSRSIESRVRSGSGTPIAGAFAGAIEFVAHGACRQPLSSFGKILSRTELDFYGRPVRVIAGPSKIKCTTHDMGMPLVSVHPMHDKLPDLAEDAHKTCQTKVEISKLLVFDRSRQ
jgi:hypothetical protein